MQSGTNRIDGPGAIVVALAFAALLAGHAMAADVPTADGVLGVSPVMENTCVALALSLGEGESVAGLRWYNNDGSTVYPAVMAVAAYPGAAPDLADAVVIVENVTGAEDSWSDLAFAQPVASPTGLFYVVFVLPANEQAVARGTGPGIGYALAASNSDVFLSAEGVAWLKMVTDKRLLVEPVMVAGEAKAQSGAKSVLMLPAPSRVEDEEVEIPSVEFALPTALHPAYPNPFNPQTTFAYELERTGSVEIAIYDIRGRLVRQITQEHQEAGHHEVVWRGEDDAGRRAASGVYLVKMRAPGYSGRTRVVMLK